MSTGFLAVSTTGEVLVSSDTRNLHFVGKAYYYYLLNSTNSYGGLRYIIYRISCNTTPVPFFTLSGNYCGVVAVKEVSSGLWEIEVILSGTNPTYPEVYVFADPRGIVSQDTSGHGLLVRNSDNTASFDSRLKPLAINYTISVEQPLNPILTPPSGLDAKYCGSQNNTGINPNAVYQYKIDLSSKVGKPIAMYQSIAQAQREYTFYAREREVEAIVIERIYEWWSYYWLFCRAGISTSSSGGFNYLNAGWIGTNWGCRWDYKRNNSFIGIGVDGDSSSGGNWPYANETLNTQPSTVIIADGSRYD